MTPLALFTGPYALLARWAVISLLVVSFGGFCWVKGDQHGTEKLTEYRARQATEAARIVVKQGAVSERVITQYVTKKVPQTKIVTQTVEKEVIRYAEANPAGLCLDADWRRVHDSAAANAVPESPDRTDGEGGAPTAAAALATVTANYAACNRTADRLDALQEWVRGQAAVQ